MTPKEINLIREQSDTTPFRVFLITDRTDLVVLRKQCQDIDMIYDKEVLPSLIARMKATLEEQDGVGLAAPQIGISRNLFLFYRIMEEGMPVQVVINPRIVAHSEERVCFQGDGCLSIPNKVGNSWRYSWIEVAYYDETGCLIKERLSGCSREDDFTAVIFQHEYDHLQGILFIDKLCNQ